MRMSGIVTCCLALLISGCASAPRYAGAAPTSRVVRAVYVERDPLLRQDDVEAACATWSPKGFACVFTRNPFAAHMFIGVDYRSCVSNARDGGHVHMVTLDERVTVFMDCFTVGGAIDQSLLRRLLAHEIGHVLGIGHVPRRCKPGQTVCGEALMNAEPELDYLTPVDSRAFDALSLEAPR